MKRLEIYKSSHLALDTGERPPVQPEITVCGPRPPLCAEPAGEVKESAVRQLQYRNQHQRWPFHTQSALKATLQL